MSLAPRVVLVHRVTEYEELIARYGTHGQAAFVLARRGGDLEGPAARHHATRRALTEIASRVPLTWRQARVERGDLDRFLFGPEDIVVAVGPDGLVANVAQYLHGQPVVGIDTDPARNPGVLVRHRPADAARLMRAAARAAVGVDALTMAEAVTDDGRELVALNEIYVGDPGHRTARYRLRAARDTAEETQASSGVLIGTGTGAGGWLRSLWRERGEAQRLPAATDARLLWYVREAWPSPATEAARVTGTLTGRGEELVLSVESDRLVAFGDGMATDALSLTWGERLRARVSERQLRLVT